jgi:energy-coupling factor transport system ATP-binding protein
LTAAVPIAAVEPPLLVEDLSFAWADGRLALHGCGLRVPGPGLWMLVGSNGSGKSTLLRLIAGLIAPRSGQIRTTTKPALVFQNPDHQLLLPSVGSDLQLGMPPDLPAGEVRGRVARALEQVGLAGLERRPIHTLSGGQKQRLAIAGALAGEAGLLLLDEPTALLDPDSQRDVLALIGRLCHRRESPLTALWITHRLEELEDCDGAARMEGGRIGPWQSGSQLRRSLNPLPAGRAER